MPSDPEPIRMSIPRPGTEAPAKERLRSIDDEGAEVIRDTRNCIERVNDLINNLRSLRD
jgi:hypothetical protein